MIVTSTLYNNSINFVLTLGSKDEIKDQIFIKRFENFIFYFIPGP